MPIDDVGCLIDDKASQMLRHDRQMKRTRGKQGDPDDPLGHGRLIWFRRAKKKKKKVYN